jgi:hypothetical protein
MRLDDDKLDALRRWGARLRDTDGEEEIAAAGRAILLLVEEVERLRLELWSLREQSSREPAALALHRRLQRTIAADEDLTSP